jgi:hypothetical protein
MTRRRKKHRPDEIVTKLRDADAMLNADKDLAAVLLTCPPLKRHHIQRANLEAGLLKGVRS